MKKTYLFLIVFATLLMGIGYASKTLTLDVKGTLIAQTPKEVLITDIKCNEGSIINNYNKTIIDSKITLGMDNNSSFMRGWEKRFFAGKGFPGKLTDMHGQHRTILA